LPKFRFSHPLNFFATAKCQAERFLKLTDVSSAFDGLYASDHLSLKAGIKEQVKSIIGPMGVAKDDFLRLKFTAQGPYPT